MANHENPTDEECEGGDEESVDVEFGDKHLSARIDGDSHKKVRKMAAEREEDMSDFIRYAVDRTLKELEKEQGNERGGAETMTAN